MKNCFILFFFFFVACQTTPSLTPDQKRALQVHIFSSVSYNTVFRAFKTIMQDEGYIIKNQDFEGGLIVAESQKSSSMNNFLIAISSGLSGQSSSSHIVGQVFSWSVNLEEIEKGKIESRIIFQKKNMYSTGGQTGNEILQPETYRNIYTKVIREINRRKALKRK